MAEPVPDLILKPLCLWLLQSSRAANRGPTDQSLNKADRKMSLEVMSELVWGIAQ